MPSTKGAIRIMTGATSIRHFMSEAIAEFRFRNPQVSLEFLTASTSTDCLTALREDAADLAWITMPSSGSADGVEQRPVLRLPWALAMRPGDIYADRVWVEVQELSGLRVVMPPRDSSSRAVLAAALTNVTLADDAGAADWDTALLLAELGVAHAIVPRLPDQPHTDGGAVHLVPLHGVPPLEVGWAARSWTALPAPARSFADTVSRNCRIRVGLGAGRGSDTLAAFQG